MNIAITKILKHKIIDLYMIICIIISVSAIFLVVHAYNEAILKEEEVGAAAYKCSTVISTNIYHESSDHQDFSNLLKNTEYNVICSNIRQYIDGIGTTCSVDYIMSMNDPSRYRFIWGSFGDEKDYDKPCVVVGKSIYQKNGNKKELHVGNIDYKIIGVLGFEHSAYYDNAIYYIYDSLTQEGISKLEGCLYYDIILQSDDFATYKEYNELFERLQMNPDLAVDIQAVDMSYITSNEEISYNILLYVFAIINSLIASVLWVYVRKNEIVILKIYGFSNARIYERLFKEIMLLTSIAAVMVFLVYGIYSVIMKNRYIFTTITEISLLFLAIPLTALLISIVSFYEIHKKSLYSNLVESEVL